MRVSARPPGVWPVRIPCAIKSILMSVAIRLRALYYGGRPTRKWVKTETLARERPYPGGHRSRMGRFVKARDAV